MDNVTHAIAGALTAELVIRFRKSEVSATWARSAVWVSMLAHNTPDFDFVYTGITEGPLGYLLHHRGHTHTLALAPLMTLLALLPVFVWPGLRTRVLRDERDRFWLLALAVLGPIGHMLLDLSNEYGVHPLWPAWNGWLYGDTIFIVEPLFWACTLPVLAAAARTWAGRIPWLLFLAAGLALAWTVGFVQRGAAIGMTSMAVLAGVLALRTSPRTRALFAFGGSLAVLAVFAIGSAKAGAIARTTLAREYSTWTTLDVSRAPRPGSPACWQVLAVQKNEAEDAYALRLLTVSVWPLVSDAAGCARGLEHPSTAPLEPGRRLEGSSVMMRGAYVGSLETLRHRARRCDVAAFMRWARAPYWVDSPLLVGDLRYDREAEHSFAEVQLEAEPVCPKHVPGWVPPRADLLGR